MMIYKSFKYHRTNLYPSCFIILTYASRYKNLEYLFVDLSSNLFILFRVTYLGIFYG